jgi:hypothetical protein
MTRENSNYENQQAEDAVLQGFAMISYLVIWPLSFFILFKFPNFANVLPWWAMTIFLLFFPYFVGTRLLRWVKESGTPIPGKDD